MSAPIAVLAVLGLLVVQRISELHIARRNQTWAREQGAVEHGARHYWMFFALHVGWLMAWPVEAWAIGPALSAWAAGLATLFVFAQCLRYWAILSLGRRWNTRILVLPEMAPVKAGPYRFLRHPNYLAVAVELAAVPLLFGAWRTAVVASLINAFVLLGVRIPAEERALGRR